MPNAKPHRSSRRSHGPHSGAAKRRTVSDSHNTSLDILQAILGQMAGANSLEVLLERTVSCLHRLFGNTATGVLQLLPGGDTLLGLAFASEHVYEGQPTIPIDTGLIGATARDLVLARLDRTGVTWAEQDDAERDRQAAGALQET